MERGLGVIIGPHIHSGFTKGRLMVGTLIALVPLVGIGVAAIGWRALAHVGIAIGTAAVLHGIFVLGERKVFGRILHPVWSSTLVMGAIVGMSILAITPYLVTLGIAAVATLLKFGQGWLWGRKYLNPAAAAKVLLLAFLSWSSFEKGMMFHPHHLGLDMISAEGFEAATGFFWERSLSPAASLMLWKTHTWIGGASGVATLLSGVLACWVLRLKWRIPLAFLGGMAVLALLVAGITGGDPLLRLAFHVFAGSVVFLAFFMATEPQSTPMPERSQYLFGVGLAILTFALQLMNVVGGSVIALVVMNLFTPLLDRVGLRRALGEGRRPHGR
ncbi:MAG: RnfABCDGE type electron transport complex subunit D [Candidatus Bipolaricaulaceae bacterium]